MVINMALVRVSSGSPLRSARSVVCGRHQIKKKKKKECSVEKFNHTNNAATIGEKQTR